MYASGPKDYWFEYNQGVRLRCLAIHNRERERDGFLAVI
jgi:hypothetical protein